MVGKNVGDDLEDHRRGCESRWNLSDWGRFSLPTVTRGVCPSRCAPAMGQIRSKVASEPGVPVCPRRHGEPGCQSWQAAGGSRSGSRFAPPRDRNLGFNPGIDAMAFTPCHTSPRIGTTTRGTLVPATLSLHLSLRLSRSLAVSPACSSGPQPTHCSTATASHSTRLHRSRQPRSLAWRETS